jgi:hypothetical protein
VYRWRRNVLRPKQLPFLFIPQGGSFPATL